MPEVCSAVFAVEAKAAGINRDRQDRDKSEAEVWAAV